MTLLVSHLSAGAPEASGVLQFGLTFLRGGQDRTKGFSLH